MSHIRFHKKPSEASSDWLWQKLQYAHYQMRLAHAEEGMKAYRTVLDYIFSIVEDISHPWKKITVAEDVPSWNWLCIYLGEYFILNQTWFTWLALFNKIPEIDIAPSIKHRLRSLEGWATIRKQPLSSIIDNQKNLLEKCNHTSRINTDFIKAHHHLILAYAYTLSFRQSDAFLHAQKAIDLFDVAEEPFWRIRAHITMGTAFYTFGQYEQAIEAYQPIFDIIQQVGEPAKSLEDWYGHGWAYLGMKKPDVALQFFQDTYERKMEYGLIYDAGRAKYAQGYCYFLMDECSEAKICLLDALRIFCDDHPQLNMLNTNTVVSPQMIAACCHILSFVCKKTQDLESAIRYVQHAISRQKKIDDPGQLYDMYRQYSHLAMLKGNIIKNVYYSMKSQYIRLKYNIPKI